MSFKFSKRSLDNMAGVDPRLIEIAHKALELTIVDFGIPTDGGIRTAERQNQLYLERKSQRDGYKKLSRHQSGRALDFYALRDGKASYEPGDLAQVAAAFLQAANILGHRVEWGGLWKSFRDMPHIELVN